METNGQFKGTNGHIENQRINIIKDKERMERTKPWMPGKNVRSTMIGEMVKYWRRLREEHKIENLNPAGYRAPALSLRLYYDPNPIPYSPVQIQSER